MLGPCWAPWSSTSGSRPSHVMPDLAPLYTGVYITRTTSKQVCETVLVTFAQENAQMCRILRNAIGDSWTYRDALATATISWGARLCSDPELPPGEYDTCDAAIFCLITSNLYECPQSFLQEHINSVRIRMKCIGPGQQVYLEKEQPDTVAVCRTSAEHAKQLKEKEIALEKVRVRNAVPVVYISEDTLYIAEPAPWVSKFTCVDLPSSSSSMLVSYKDPKGKLR